MLVTARPLVWRAESQHPWCSGVWHSFRTYQAQQVWECEFAGTGRSQTEGAVPWSMDVPEAAGARGLGGCPGGAHEGAQLWALGGRGDPGRGLIQLDKKCCRKRHPTEKTGCSENFVRGRRIYCRRRRVWGVQWPRSTVSLRLDFSRLAHPRGVRARGARFLRLRFRVCLVTQGGRGSFGWGAARGKEFPDRWSYLVTGRFAS